MESMNVSVREITQQDIPLITQYWLEADATFMQGMGVDMSKMLTKKQWHEMLSEQLSQPYNEKKSYCIIWQLNGKAIGHSNVNKIIFGEEAYMHLHLWNTSVRKKGMGTELVKMTLPYFFKNLQLKKLYCEPYALNLAPNKTLEKIGFTFIKKYTTTPGFLNFEQEVNKWELSYAQFKKATQG
jgi:RimJ/RimL family protein N-acetyltransferase